MKAGRWLNASSFTQEEISSALQEYARIISKWPELMFLSGPIPEDLTKSSEHLHKGTASKL
jgi:hypothetical protein